MGTEQVESSGSTLTDEALEEALRRVLPVRGGTLSLAFVGMDATAEAGHRRVCFQLIEYESAHERAAEKEVRETYAPLLCAAHHRRSPERALAYIEGWALALRTVLAAISDITSPTYLLPFHFVAEDVLDMPTPKTRDDFCRALLAKKRLGRLMKADNSVMASPSVRQHDPK